MRSMRSLACVLLLAMAAKGALSFTPGMALRMPMSAPVSRSGRLAQAQMQEVYITDPFGRKILASPDQISALEKEKEEKAAAEAAAAAAAEAAEAAAAEEAKKGPKKKPIVKQAPKAASPAKAPKSSAKTSKQVAKKSDSDETSQQQGAVAAGLVIAAAIAYYANSGGDMSSLLAKTGFDTPGQTPPSVTSRK